MTMTDKVCPTCGLPDWWVDNDCPDCGGMPYEAALAETQKESE